MMTYTLIRGAIVTTLAVAVSLLAMILLFAGSGFSGVAVAAELPKCNDNRVLEKLTEDYRKGAKALFSNYQYAVVMAQQGLMAQAARGRDLDQAARKAGLATAGPGGLPDVREYVEKVDEAIDAAAFTYSGEREEMVVGNTKHCAADMRMNTIGVFGDPTEGNAALTYTVQLTEDGDVYVKLTGEKTGSIRW